jgi:glycosyltransferase involved in cell wall biosynthesis
MVTDNSWKWFQEKIENRNDYIWKFYNPLPKNIIEKYIKKPNLARLRACYNAGSDYKKGKTEILVSHLPIYSAWTEYFAGEKKKERFHLAFSFNFTTMPNEKQTKFMKEQFKKIDRFTVFSNYERNFYSNYFNIPIEKIDMIHWGVAKPKIVEMDRVIQGEYVCAIGGEGRDYRTLALAAKQLPNIKFVIVAREKNLVGIEFSENVEIYKNIPLDKTMNIMNNSTFAIVPLESRTTPCGHVTIVSAMHLGKAQIVTYSEGVTDYIKDRETGLFTEDKNSNDMKYKIEELYNNKELREKIEVTAKQFAERYCTEEANVEYFEKVLKEKEKTV